MTSGSNGLGTTGDAWWSWITRPARPMRLSTMPRPDRGSHPPHRSGRGIPACSDPAPTDYLNTLVKRVLPLIAEHFGIGPVMPVRARGNFSLVTTAPDALTPDQCVPHVDTAEPLQFACVHFLCDAAHGGTGFFRHRSTGFETLDAARAPIYSEALARELDGLPRRYPQPGDDGPFELIHTCDAARDRLILYRASALHSGLIGAVGPDAANSRRGRLTGNLFLQCRQVTA